MGFDACLDYKTYPDAEALSRALIGICPQGVDGYFENVGGMVLNAVLPRMNAFSSIALCGLISGYDGQLVPLANPGLLREAKNGTPERTDPWTRASPLSPRRAMGRRTEGDRTIPHDRREED